MKNNKNLYLIGGLFLVLGFLIGFVVFTLTSNVGDARRTVSSNYEEINLYYNELIQAAKSNDEAKIENLMLEGIRKGYSRNITSVRGLELNSIEKVGPLLIEDYGDLRLINWCFCANWGSCDWNDDNKCVQKSTYSCYDGQNVHCKRLTINLPSFSFFK